VRILLTVPSLDRSFGGPIGKASALMRALGALGHSVTLVGAGDGAGGIGLGQIGHFHATPMPRRVAPLLDAVCRADVVHVLGLRDPVGTIAALKARQRRVPLVVEPVGMHRRWLRSMTVKRLYDGSVGRVVMGTAARVVAASQMEADEMVEDGVDRRRISIRSNGVWFEEPLSRPRRGALRRELGIPATAPLVVTIARINAIKGLPLLARALSQLPNVWGLITGPDEHDGTLENLLRLRTALHHGDRLVVLPEGLWGERKTLALAEADCFCLPSLHESFGTAAIEAAGVGIPVVTTSGCGVAEWLEPSASRVVAPGDVGALSDAIADVLTSRSFREGASRGMARIRSELSWPRLAQRQLAIYQEALLC
jgi:glycosyltransferase involved in cell wall biosynthesis